MKQALRTLLCKLCTLAMLAGFSMGAYAKYEATLLTSAEVLGMENGTSKLVVIGQAHKNNGYFFGIDNSGSKVSTLFGATMEAGLVTAGKVANDDSYRLLLSKTNEGKYVIESATSTGNYLVSTPAWGTTEFGWTALEVTALGSVTDMSADYDLGNLVRFSTDGGANYFNSQGNIANWAIKAGTGEWSVWCVYALSEVEDPEPEPTPEVPEGAKLIRFFQDNGNGPRYIYASSASTLATATARQDDGSDMWLIDTISAENGTYKIKNVLYETYINYNAQLDASGATTYIDATNPAAAGFSDKVCIAVTDGTLYRLLCAGTNNNIGYGTRASIALGYSAWAGNATWWRNCDIVNVPTAKEALQEAVDNAKAAGYGEHAGEAGYLSQDVADAIQNAIVAAETAIATGEGINEAQTALNDALAAVAGAVVMPKVGKTYILRNKQYDGTKDYTLYMTSEGLQIASATDMSTAAMWILVDMGVEGKYSFKNVATGKYMTYKCHNAAQSYNGGGVDEYVSVYCDWTITSDYATLPGTFFLGTTRANNAAGTINLNYDGAFDGWGGTSTGSATDYCNLFYLDEVSPLTDGEDYYILNVSTGTWLGGANSWGTQASVVAHPQPFKAVLAEGAVSIYSFDSHTYNKAAEHFLGNNLYVDATTFGWDVEAQGGGVYALGKTDGYIATQEGSTVLTTVADITPASQWKLFTKADLLAQLATATEETPGDATFLVKAANFSRNQFNKNFEGAWTVEASNCTLFGGNNDNTCAESWQSAFHVYQTVEVPNGYYKLTAQAALTDYAGLYDGSNYPVFYANSESVPFNNMEEADRATSMSKLSTSFTAGKYPVGPLYVQVTDGQLTVGFQGTRTDTWAIWDNIEISYLGNPHQVEIGETGRATLYYPEALSIPEGVKAYTCVVGENGVEKTEVTGAIPAETPVLLMAATATYKFYPTTAAALNQANDLVGTVLEDGETFAEEGYKYYILADGEDGVGFYWQTGTEGNSVLCAQYKAALRVAAEEEGGLVKFYGLDGETSIENVENANTNTTAIRYNLAGQRVNANYRGVVIENGQKVLK